MKTPVWAPFQQFRFWLTHVLAGLMIGNRICLVPHQPNCNFVGGLLNLTIYPKVQHSVGLRVGDLGIVSFKP